MAATEARARERAVPGSYDALQYIAEHASLGALVNWQEDRTLGQLRDAREARAIDLLDTLIVSVGEDGRLDPDEQRTLQRLAALLRRLNEREDALHARAVALNAREREHEAAVSRGADRALACVECKRNGFARDEVFDFLAVVRSGQMVLTLLGEEE